MPTPVIPRSLSYFILLLSPLVFSPSASSFSPLCRQHSQLISPSARPSSLPWLVSRRGMVTGGGGDFFDEISEPASTPPSPSGTPGQGSSSERKPFEQRSPASRPMEEEDDSSGGEPMAWEDLERSTTFEDHIPKLNTVTLSGRVGNDPEPRYFDDGKVVLNLSLAVRRKYHPLERKVMNIKSGEEETDWFPLEMWGRDAEYASNYVTKGARIGITGSLVVDCWNDRNTGEPRRRAKIAVKHLDILESRAEAELRKSNQGRGGGYDGGGGGGTGGGGRRYYNENDEDGGPSSAGTGGFFD